MNRPPKPATKRASKRPVACLDSATQVSRELSHLSSPERREVSMRFFKTGPGQYGQGDTFIGVTVPQAREVAARAKGLGLSEVLSLLRSPIHEERLCALIIWVNQFEKGDQQQRAEIYREYVKNAFQVNSWDLVDSSAPTILGGHLWSSDMRASHAKREGRTARSDERPNVPRAPAKAVQQLREWAASPNLWVRRMAILATHHWIRDGAYLETLEIADRLTAIGRTEHDLIHKAVGWMLREVGKVDIQALRSFLESRLGHLPRTTLRYAIERLPANERRSLLSVSKPPETIAK